MSELQVGVRRLNDTDDIDSSLAGFGELYTKDYALVGEPLSRVFVEGELGSAWVVEISYPSAAGPDVLEVIPVSSWIRGTYRDEPSPSPERRSGRSRRSDRVEPPPYVALKLSKPSTVPTSLLPPPPAGRGFPCNMFNFPFC